MFMNVSVLPSQDLWALCFNSIYETCIQLKSDRIIAFYILCHQMMRCPAVNNNEDLEFFRHLSVRFAIHHTNLLCKAKIKF